MMLRLSLVDSPVASEFVFGAEGGLFGRSLKCNWVLTDEDRILSAIHGRIQFDGSRFSLIDESTNGIFLDGRQEPLGRGNTVVLQNGMRFRAARHIIRADILPGRDTAVHAPDPLRSAMPPSAPMQQPFAGGQPAYGAEQALRQNEAMGDLWGRNSLDPLAYLGAPATAVNSGQQQAGIPAAPNPVPQAAMPSAWPEPPASQSPATMFAAGSAYPTPSATPIPQDFLPVTPQQPAATSYPQRQAQPFPAPQPLPAPPAGRKLIPDDFDPLSVLGGAIRRGQPRQADAWSQPPASPPSAPPPIPMQAAHLFASGAPVPPMPAGAGQPPTGAKEQLSPSLMAVVARIGEPPSPPAPSPVAGVPGDFDAVEAMKARREERKARLLEKSSGRPVLAPVASAAPPASAVIPASMPLPQAAGFPPAHQAAPFPTASQGAGFPPMSQATSFPAPPQGAGFPAIPQSGGLPPMPVGAPMPAQSGGDRDAVSALFAGMGFPDAQIPPERHIAVMHEMGEMVRALSDGLVLLLSARRMVKSEFRMDETQVQPEENNPFKHFKIAELALDELFLTRSGGFQAPAEAAGSAFEDVKQHVMLTMSAMQRAVRLLMERLGPENTAREDEGGSLRIRGLGSGKGKWESYVETHSRMSGNIDAVTRQIIAESFAQVQEEQARRVASQYWESKK